MSAVLEFGGRAFVAGLYWEPPGAEVDKAERREWAWSAEWGEQTGWVPKDAGLKGAEGVPSLAASVAEYLSGTEGQGTESGWFALLKADDGSFAVLRFKDGVIVRGGDEVFEEESGALDSMGTAQAEGAVGFGTSGVARESGLLDLDLHAVAEGSGEFGLVRERSGSSPLRMAAAVGAVAVVMVGGVWVLAPDMLSGLFGGPEKEESEAVQEEPQVWALIDSVALVEECGTAQVEWPPYLPAWEIGRIACHGWFEEPALIGERPELEGRAVMVVQWELPGQYVAALHRRIAEEHLGRWYYAQVGDTSAWALMPLGSVIRSGDDATAPSHLAFRREVDRHFGMQGARIAYGGPGDAVAVTVALGQGLSRIEGLVAGTPGFELLSLTRGGRGGWVLEARPQAGFLVRESVFEALAGARRGVDAAS